MAKKLCSKLCLPATVFAFSRLPQSAEQSRRQLYVDVYPYFVMSLNEGGGTKRTREGELHLTTPHQTPLHKRARVRVVKVVQSVLTKYFTTNVASVPLPPKSGPLDGVDEEDD